MDKKPTHGVVQDGTHFRIYNDEDHLGDRDYLVDTITAPVRCDTPGKRRDWFNQTLLAKSLMPYRIYPEN